MADGDALFLAAPLDLRALANTLDLCPFARLAAAADVAAWHPPAQRPRPASVPMRVLPRNRRIRPRPRDLFSALASMSESSSSSLEDVHKDGEQQQGTASEDCASKPPRMPKWPRTPPRPPAPGARVLQVRQHEQSAPRVRLDLRLDPAGVFVTPSPKKRQSRILVSSPSDVRATALEF